MSVNGLSNTSFPLTLSGLTLTDDLSSTYIPYANASNAINLNNQAVSNVASLAVVGTVSGASVTASGTVSGATLTSSGAINGSSLAITNHATSNSLTVGTTTFVVSKIFSYVFSGTFIVYVTNMPSYWSVGDQIQVTGIASFSPSFNRVYTINAFNGTTGFYTTFVNIPGVPGYYETSSGSCYRASGVVGQVFSDSVYNVNNASTNTLTVRTSASIANLTATGTNSISNLTCTGNNAISNLTATGTNVISNLTTTGTLNASIVTASTSVGTPIGNITTANCTTVNTSTVVATGAVSGATVSATGAVSGATVTTTGTITSGGAVICNNTTAIGYWLPINGTTSIYMTDTSANVATPATTFSRYFATGGNVYQDFYGTFYWRGSTTLNSGNVVQRMSLSTTALNVSVGTAITGTFDVTGNTTVIGTVGITGATGVTGNVSILGTFGVTGVQSLKAGAFGSSGDYTVSTTDILGSTVFDGGNVVNIQCQASNYGRNILYMTGRAEGSPLNDAFSFFAPRNAISFRTQATLNSGYTNRYTIQNFADQLGIMCAGKASVPITKWGNDGTMTHTDNMDIGGILSLTKTNDGVLRFANTASIYAKNSGGTYETFLWPRFSDNIMYLNYGSAGFHIRNNASATTMFMNNSNQVGIGHSTPICTLDVFGGRANIWTGTRFAVPNNYMSAGSLTIGSITQTYGGTNNWSANTAGLMMETNMDTEICCHHSGNSVNSLLYYEGNSRRIFIGAGMGWGENPQVNEGTIYAVSNITTSLRSTYGQLVVGQGYGNNSIIHRHDGNTYYMLISNGAYDSTWNGLRPFYIDIASGQLNSNNTQYFRGGCIVERNTRSGSHGDAALYVSADTGDSIIECRHSNGSQGVGIRYNGIFATGYNANQDLNIYARGNGALALRGSNVQLPEITAQSVYTGAILQLSNSNDLKYGQLTSARWIVRGSWGGGVSIGSFDKGSTSSTVVITGDASYYVSSAGNTEIVIRFYNTRTGVYYYMNYLQFTNVTSNHTNLPFTNLAAYNNFPYGYYNIYAYLQSGNWITDGNDYINLLVMVHP